jgi:NAD(P)-dependent dehydrogenase (short-subunit alcohol dehydrogenase family)
MDLGLSGARALVTGASRGIGRAAAVTLARAGAHVIAVARTQGALEDLDDQVKQAGGKATLVPCDLKDMPALDRLGGAIAQRWGKLDIFVGNGAILGPLAPLGHVSPKEWDEVMAINVTANWRLIRSFDPLLRLSDDGRVVLVGSGASWSCPAYWGPYSISKAALDAIARTYAAECAETKIRVNVFNPGATRTRMRAQAAPGEDPDSLPTPEDIVGHLVALCRPDFRETGGVMEGRTGILRRFRAPE